MNPFSLGIQADDAPPPKISSVFRPKNVVYKTGYDDLKRQFAERYDYVYKYQNADLHKDFIEERVGYKPKTVS